MILDGKVRQRLIWCKKYTCNGKTRLTLETRATPFMVGKKEQVIYGQVIEGKTTVLEFDRPSVS